MSEVRGIVDSVLVCKIATGRRQVREGFEDSGLKTTHSYAF